MFHHSPHPPKKNLLGYATSIDAFFTLKLYLNDEKHRKWPFKFCWMAIDIEEGSEKNDGCMLIYGWFMVDLWLIYGWLDLHGEFFIDFQCY